MSVAVADLNGDAKPDLVAVTQNGGNNGHGSVAVLLGDGDGSFTLMATYDSGDFGGWSVAATDLNDDAKVDIVVANYGTRTVGVLLGNGDGTFQQAVMYDTGDSNPAVVRVADVNGDGKPDLVTANGFSVGVLLGNGDGTFRPAVVYDPGVTTLSVAVADVNGDGKSDVVACGGRSHNGTGTVGVLLGNGDGTFRTALTYPSGVSNGGYSSSVGVADLNGDGKLDVVTANYPDDTVGVLLGNGDGTLQTAVTYESGGPYAWSTALADLDSDGKVDILVADQNGSTLGVLLAHGDGTFQAAETYSAPGQAELVATADVNGDGRPDAVVAAGGNWVDVFLNALGLSPTTTTVVGTKNPVQPRQRVDYIATVTTESGATPTGTVTFRDGNQTLATSPLFGNQARLNYIHYTQNDLGAHSITAIYSGDADNAPSTSPVYTEKVQWSSRMDVTTSGSPSLVGQPVTFTATPISHGNFVPDGELITFFDFKTMIGTASTSGGQAKFTTSSLSAKRHTIRATYPGDAIRQPSSSSVPQVVNKYSTTSSLTSSPNPSGQGQTVTFTATVTPSGPFTPTGKVKFLDGTTGLGYATLSGSVATFSKSHLAVGTHSITAQYLGDATSDKSTSSAVSQVVNP